MNDIAPEQSIPIKLDAGFSISDLTSGKGIQFEVKLDDDKSNPSDDDYQYTPDDIVKHLNCETLGFTDEDTYDESQPFESLAKKMTNVTENGKVKKRVLKPGLGEIVPELSEVTVHYNAYVEYNDEPFDSTYIRKQPFHFRLGNGETLPGLDAGVATMRPNEKAQFLVHPDFAYGKYGCLDRIPANAHILYEVELVSYKNTGATVTYPQLDEEKQNSFEEIQKYALGMCSKGNDYFRKRNHKLALREYNRAVGKLANCQVADYAEQELQQKLLFRLYINLVITCSMLKDPRKCCINCNNLYYLVKGTALKVPAKVYFHNGRALILLGDFKRAEEFLAKARRIEPNNPEIAQEFRLLEEMRKKTYAKEKALAQAFLRANISDEHDFQASVEPNDSFKKLIADLCEELKVDEGAQQYKMPAELSDAEKAYVKKCAADSGLFYLEKDADCVYISKSDSLAPSDGKKDQESDDEF